jgi:RNA polymerase sigma-70 factor (ECF subfamily)
MLNNEDEACDATQEAFVRAYGAVHTFRRDASFSTWLYRIVINVCLDRLRRRGRERDSLRLLSDTADDDSVRDIPDERNDPEAEALKTQRQALVQEGLAGLTSEHRAVIVLYDLQGLSYEEIGAVLAVPVGTVKSRLNRARLALRTRLEPHLELFQGS